VVALRGVVVDRRAEIFKIAAGSTIVASVFRILSTGFAGDFGKHLAAPKFVEAAEAPIELRTIGLPRSRIVIVDRQNVGDVDQLDVLFFADWIVLGGEVVGKGLLRLSTFALSASRGDMLAGVEDNPDRLRTELAALAPSGGSEIEPWRLFSTRHNSLISSMLANVV
jgi:hypothetical protein